MWSHQKSCHWAFEQCDKCSHGLYQICLGKLLLNWYSDDFQSKIFLKDGNEYMFVYFQLNVPFYGPYNRNFVGSCILWEEVVVGIGSSFGYLDGKAL